MPIQNFKTMLEMYEKGDRLSYFFCPITPATIEGVESQQILTMDDEIELVNTKYDTIVDLFKTLLDKGFIPTFPLRYIESQGYDRKTKTVILRETRPYKIDDQTMYLVLACTVNDQYIPFIIVDINDGQYSTINQWRWSQPLTYTGDYERSHG